MLLILGRNVAENAFKNVHSRDLRLFYTWGVHDKTPGHFRTVGFMQSLDINSFFQIYLLVLNQNYHYV